MNHLVVLLEDQPYRDIVNGVKLSPRVDVTLLDVKEPLGGWSKVFESLENNKHLLTQYEGCHILLLMDFDDKEKDSQSSFQKRRKKLQEIVFENFKERVFLLGINHKESEDLKRHFDKKFEEIGEMIVENCPDSDLSCWENTHLKCNLPEIERMKKSGVFKWLFKK